ncbi:hypothetical protein P5673_019982 [Acropora cervicornis]|uniref:Uncharacterized protein n=1 Tax=Acropora cervicornis TaxID=6130 RepID=A0AAD9QAF8_ACRCE|nr:hypothetical protein P5673_019982 [Acropora cervicornis]
MQHVAAEWRHTEDTLTKDELTCKPCGKSKDFLKAETVSSFWICQVVDDKGTKAETFKCLESVVRVLGVVEHVVVHDNEARLCSFQKIVGFKKEIHEFGPIGRFLRATSHPMEIYELLFHFVSSCWFPHSFFVELPHDKPRVFFFSCLDLEWIKR